MALPLEKIEEKVEKETDKFALQASQGFAEWLSKIDGSLAFSTYQVGKILFVGLNAEKKLSIFERTFPRSMGIGVSKDCHSLLLATKTQIYAFDNLLEQHQLKDGYDALYAPHMSWITGNVDLHDIGFDENNDPIFISTAFNCIAKVARGYSFKPVWRPPFISKIVGEDRCHLNGMVVQNGKPKYATCVSKTDVFDGWRTHRSDGGVLIDIESNQIIVENLSMPHSPRLHDGRLWLLNSGKGEFGWVDIDAKVFHPIAFCPGFARGLSFAGKYAIIGLSEPREGKTFDGLPLQERMQERGEEARCGLCVVDTQTGETVEWLTIEGVISELYDVSFIAGIKRPAAVGIIGKEIDHMIAISA